MGESGIACPNTGLIVGDFSTPGYVVVYGGGCSTTTRGLDGTVIDEIRTPLSLCVISMGLEIPDERSGSRRLLVEGCPLSPDRVEVVLDRRYCGLGRAVASAAHPASMKGSGV